MSVNEPDSNLTIRFRDIPYGWDMFMENVLDPAHVPVSHHNIVGNRFHTFILHNYPPTRAITPSSSHTEISSLTHPTTSPSSLFFLFPLLSPNNTPFLSLAPSLFLDRYKDPMHIFNKRVPSRSEVPFEEGGEYNPLYPEDKGFNHLVVSKGASETSNDFRPPCLNKISMSMKVRSYSYIITSG